MKRIAVITAGKTHSGKTTFARELEQKLDHSIVIDQDNHAAFINTYYRKLLPKDGPNTIKYAITQTIADYAVKETDFHLIICSSNLSRKGRTALLSYYRNQGFSTVLVSFQISEDILRERVKNSSRSTDIFRSAASFQEVLARQSAESLQADKGAPSEDEADYFFEIKSSEEVREVISTITNINYDQNELAEK
ncbi:ATP-binding protein [Peribacillus sp. SCS-37]|uniref:ATP-binding protein n=1 Tax=Paraperibacillus esterisolvens TaxID=3115296 RepID=UPI003906CBC3